MIETIIRFKTFDDVNEFVKLTSMCVDEVLVYSGRYIVSGKSIMGMYSLDLSKDLKVEFCGEIPEEAKEGIKRFIVE